MIDQIEVPVEARAPIGAAKLELSEEVLASLHAVRVAQEAARVRARRQTMQTRLWFATSVAVLALVAVAVAPRVARWRHAHRPATTVALPSPAVSAEPAAAPTSPVRAEPVLAQAAGLSAPAPSPERSAPALAPVPAPTKAREGVVPAEGCDTALIRSAPWRLSPEACARAFDANPNDARLALAIAHAEHARGHLPDAAQWAKRALSLDANAAEAYVLIARADTHGGRPDDARAAYGRYLDLAPRGWHQAEARAALRRPRGTPDSSGAR